MISFRYHYEANIDLNYCDVKLIFAHYYKLSHTLCQSQKETAAEAAVSLSLIESDYWQVRVSAQALVQAQPVPGA